MSKKWSAKEMQERIEQLEIDLYRTRNCHLCRGGGDPEYVQYSGVGEYKHPNSGILRRIRSNECGASEYLLKRSGRRTG